MNVEISEPQTAYPVEVSGRDHELHWSEQSGKHILLLRPIVSGSLVFLRPIDPLSTDRVRPVPYRAELLEATKSGPCRYGSYWLTVVAEQVETATITQWEKFSRRAPNRNKLGSHCASGSRRSCHFDDRRSWRSSILRGKWRGTTPT